MTYPCLRGFGVLLSLCLSGALCAADYSKWRCYRVLQLDTTAAGADVAGDVKDFPLAVALTAANFDFATAKPDGSDLRFTNDKDDAPLLHAVERWDAQAKSALVWVKVPLIRGNRSDQVIFMQWQNPEAQSVARPLEVFDTKDGFIGVFHLDDEGSSARPAATRTPRPTRLMAPASISCPARASRVGWDRGSRSTIRRTNG